jgi:hypothetical protein
MFYRMYVFPPDDTPVAIALRFQNIALRTSIPSWTSKILNFEWQARHQFCDCSFYTQGQRQWQRPKVKEERKGKEGRVRETQVPSGRSSATYGTCEGDLPLIHKHFLTVDSILREQTFWEYKVFLHWQTIFKFFRQHGWKKSIKKCFAIYQKLPPFILQVREHNLSNR